MARRKIDRTPATLTVEQAKEHLSAANAAEYEPARFTCGCGRAYVVLCVSRADSEIFAAAAKELGILYLDKAYGTLGQAIYCGYDNADGRALAKSRAFAATLQARGIKCYDDAVGD